MNDKPLDQRNQPEENQTEILVNEYGETRDGTVVIEEADRTVLLTQDETIVIDKEPRIDVVPKNRPRKVYGGMWGPAELVTVSFAMVALFIAALLYIFMLAPAKRELETNRAERDKLERELISTRSKYGEITSTETHVAKLMSSVEDFEARNLSVASNGRASLYQRVNGLISAYGLVNSSGPDYAPLETLTEGNAEGDQESGRSKFKSLFPGVYVTMTLEGPYQNMRRFIRELETSRGEFIVLSSVELEPSDSQEKPQQQQNNAVRPGGPVVNSVEGYTQVNPANPTMNAQPSAPPRRQRGKTHGEAVSLKLELAAYFRRPNVMPQFTAPTEQ